MILYLLRHGKVDQKDPRHLLTARGTEEAREIAAWARRERITISRIEHSPVARTRDTALLFAEEFPDVVITASDEVGPNASADELLVRLSAETENLLVVSHQPTLNALAALLDPRSNLDFAPTGLAAFERTAEGWTFLWYQTPGTI